MKTLVLRIGAMWPGRFKQEIYYGVFKTPIKHYNHSCRITCFKDQVILKVRVSRVRGVAVAPTAS